MVAAISIGAMIFFMFGLHWRRLRRACVGIFSKVPAIWHALTEHRFERVTSSPEAAEALSQLRADRSLKFRARLARVDDMMGGYSGSADMIERSIKKQRFCVWELERYCRALDYDDAWLWVGKDVAERYANYLPPIKSAKEDAEARVAYLLATRRGTAAQDYISKQLWIASASAVASAVAALAAVISSHSGTGGANHPVETSTSILAHSSSTCAPRLSHGGVCVAPNWP